jgi:hypothetical protein
VNGIAIDGLAATAAIVIIAVCALCRSPRDQIAAVVRAIFGRPEPPTIVQFHTDSAPVPPRPIQTDTEGQQPGDATVGEKPQLGGTQRGAPAAAAPREPRGSHRKD